MRGFRPIVLLACAASTVCAATLPGGAEASRFVQVDDPERWRATLEALGLEATGDEAALRIYVGHSEAARAVGVERGTATMRVAALAEELNSDLDVFWEEPLELPVARLPPTARIFTREKHSGAPLVAGWRRGDGRSVLWLAADPGASGYLRFPYLLHALVEMGARPPFESDRLWVFFDDSYRLRADPDYLARAWRRAGVAAIHVSAWHFYERDGQRDEFLRRVIEAAHGQGIAAYAWLELPHVSDAFWEQNPQCRERTATGEDARLDWRKLVNLVDEACAAMVEEGTAELLTRFEWDGVNLAELYFESLLGPEDPARFTPMNSAYREQAGERLGFDPLELFDREGTRYWNVAKEDWERLVDDRAGTALELQKRWLRFIRATLPEAGLVVTQIDDRFDPGMRYLLGADTAALLPFADELDFTLLIEDPAPLWSLGPERYPEIAKRYEPLTDEPRRLAIDINIVERYQQTYPTRKQVGVELFRLAHLAASAFERTALYFEHSIEKTDRGLLPMAAQAARVVEEEDGAVVVESRRPVGLRKAGRLGGVRVDGVAWPLISGDGTAWLPAGRHRVEATSERPPGRVLRLNADLRSARVEGDAATVWYRADPPAYVLLDRRPRAVRIDGRAREDLRMKQTREHWSVRLPRGEHEAQFEF